MVRNIIYIPISEPPPLELCPKILIALNDQNKTNKEFRKNK